jgi:hypothetical protein
MRIEDNQYLTSPEMRRYMAQLAQEAEIAMQEGTCCPRFTPNQAERDKERGWERR